MGDVGKLSACLKQLQGLNLDTLKDRKLLQKRIYLLQAFGVDLGYHFGWYIYGPYSPDLTRDAFDLRMQLAEARRTMHTKDLRSQEHVIMKRFKSFLSSISGAGEQAERLELIASLHFLSKKDSSLDKTDVMCKLKEFKVGRFTDRAIRQGMKELLKSGIMRFSD